jgi:hypothetical protein
MHPGPLSRQRPVYHYAIAAARPCALVLWASQGLTPLHGSQCSHVLSRLPRWGNASRPAALAADAAFLPGLRHGQGHTSVSYNYQVCTTHGERPRVEVQREARARRGRRSGDEVEHRQVGGLGSRLDRDLMLEATLKCLSRALSASRLTLSHTPTSCPAAQHCEHCRDSCPQE